MTNFVASLRVLDKPLPTIPVDLILVEDEVEPFEEVKEELERWCDWRFRSFVWVSNFRDAIHTFEKLKSPTLIILDVFLREEENDFVNDKGLQLIETISEHEDLIYAIFIRSNHINQIAKGNWQLNEIPEEHRFDKATFVLKEYLKQLKFTAENLVREYVTQQRGDPVCEISVELENIEETERGLSAEIDKLYYLNVYLETLDRQALETSLLEYDITVSSPYAEISSMHFTLHLDLGEVNSRERLEIIFRDHRDLSIRPLQVSIFYMARLIRVFDFKIHLIHKGNENA